MAEQAPTATKEETIKEQVQEQAQQLGDQAQRIKEQAVDGYHQVEQRAEALKQNAEEINKKAVDFIQANPALTIVGAFGIGYLVGSLAARRWLI